MGYPAYMPSVQTSCDDRKAATPKSSESPGAINDVVPRLLQKNARKSAT